MKFLNQRLARLSRRLDPLWWLAARALRLRPDARQGLAPRSILVVDLHLLGDIVMLVPLLRVLRRCHPQARLALVAGPWSRDVLAGEGLVDEWVLLQAPWVRRAPGSSGWRGVLAAVRRLRAAPDAWDWGIDVRGDVRNALLLALARARRRVAFGFTGGAALLTDVVPDDGVPAHIVAHHATIARHLGMDMTAAEATPTLTAPPAGAAALRNRIGFHFGASMPLRRMPLAEACDLLLRVIAETQPDADLYLVDAPDTRELNGAVLARLAVAPGRRLRRWEGDLAALKALLAQTHRFYAVDSGPAHLAAALGAETFVFFGPTLPVESRPLGPRVHVIERTDLGCRPCDRIHCTNPRYQECLTQVVRLLEPAGRLPAGGGDAVPLRAAPPAP